MPMTRCVSSTVANCSITWTRTLSKTVDVAGTVSESEVYTSALSGNTLADAQAGTQSDLAYTRSPYSYIVTPHSWALEAGGIATLAIPAAPSPYTSADITEVRWKFTGQADWTSTLTGATNVANGLAWAGGSGTALGPIVASIYPSGDDPTTSIRYLLERYRFALSGADVMGDGYEYYVYRTKHKYGDTTYTSDLLAPDSHVFRPISQLAPTSVSGGEHISGGGFGSWIATKLGTTQNLRFGMIAVPDMNLILAAYPGFGTMNYAGVGTLVVNLTGFNVTIDIVYAGDDTPVGSGMTNPWNLQDRQGRFHRVGVNGGIQYLRSDFAVPKPSWAVTSQVTTNGADANPRQALDVRNRIHVVWERSGGSLEAMSDDDGQTWGTPSTMIAGGTKPTIAVGHDGSILRAAYVSGVIQGTYQAQGDTSASAVFTFQKWNGSALVDIAVNNDTFHLQQGHEGPARWLLSLVESGATDTSDWWSGDDGRTWTKIT